MNYVIVQTMFTHYTISWRKNQSTGVKAEGFLSIKQFVQRNLLNSTESKQNSAYVGGGGVLRKLTFGL